MKFISDYPELMKEWNYEKNVGIDPSKIRYGSDRKVWWKCEKGHEWFACCKSRAGKIKKRCPCCSNQKVCLENCLATKNPEIAKEWHPTKNGNLTPFDVIAGSHRKVWWYREACNHEWFARIAHRTGKDKCGCPVCKELKGESSIRNYLEKNSIDFISQFRLDYGGRADFYFPQMNLIIEYQGWQHYIATTFGSKQKNADLKGLYDTVKRDFRKALDCKRKGIRLIRIPFWELKNIEQILDCIFAGKDLKFSEPPRSVKKYQAKRDAIIERCKKIFETDLTEINK